MLKEDIATRRRGGKGGENDRWKKSRAARELSRSQCVEPHPSRPLPPSRISPLSVSRSLPRDLSRIAGRAPRSYEGTHRRAYPFFIIGIGHRLLFYNNRCAAAVAPLSRASTISFCNAGGTHHAPEVRKEEPSPVEGVQRFIAINRRWPVVTPTAHTRSRTHTPIVTPSCPVRVLRNCEKIVRFSGLSVGWSADR